MTNAHPLELKRNVALGFAALALALLLSPKASQAMTISPPTLDFTLNPGDVIADVVQVFNEEGIPFKVTPVPVNFFAPEGGDSDGSPEFYDAKEVRNSYELAPWFVLSETPVVIPPNERVNVPFQIAVPEDAQPGSHFGAIQILASKPDEVPGMDAASVGIDRGTTVLIFVRIAGDAKDELRVADFGAQSGMLSHLPADFTVRLTNEGNTHQRPVGNIIIESMLGRQVATLQVNPGPQYKSILPGTARRFDASWFRNRLPEGAGEYESQLRNFAFGKYTATLLINYGSSSQQKNLTAVTTFWVIPWLALATYVGAALLAVLVVVLIFRGYNAMLIRRYEAGRQK